MSKYACPKCGENLNLTQTKDFVIETETGLCYLPTVTNYVYCSNCDWAEDNLEDSVEELDIVDKIIQENISKDIL